MGFSAFPDGGRFEALRRTGPGEEKPVAVQEYIPWAMRRSLFCLFLITSTSKK